jgi:Effector-associated domain 11
MDNTYIINIKGLIANERLSDAFRELLTLIEGKPQHERFANELIILYSRYKKLTKEIRVGILSPSEENVIRNQITFALLNLLDEFEISQKDNPDNIFPKDKISVVGEKNVVIGSSITASGDFRIGDNIVVNVGSTKVEPKYIERQIQSMNKIKVLFIASNPLDTGRLRLEKEMREIDLELSRAKYRDRFEFSKYMDARLDDLLNILLEDTPHFVHFSGHGTNEGIVFMDDKTEKSHVVKSKSLGNLFKLFSNDIACVFLNSCYSRQQGKEIVQFIPRAARFCA